jgi:5-methyltetrahydrofolate--homocysteine methyltransferase
MNNESLQSLFDAIVDGDDIAAQQAAESALAGGAAPDDVLDTVNAASDELGRLYENGDCFLPELFAGAEAMTAAVDIVIPEIEKAGVEPAGKIIIASVEGDVHEIGKRIVGAMLSGAGFRVFDLGADVPTGEIIGKALEVRPDIVAASAYITTTTQRLPEIGEALEEAGLRGDISYLIGGASVGEGMVPWAHADAYAANAVEAVRVARELVKAAKGVQ